MGLAPERAAARPNAATGVMLVDRGHPFRHVRLFAAAGPGTELAGGDQEQQDTKDDLDPAHPRRGGTGFAAPRRAGDGEHDGSDDAEAHQPPEDEQRAVDPRLRLVSMSTTAMIGIGLSAIPTANASDPPMAWPIMPPWRGFRRPVPRGRCSRRDDGKRRVGGVQEAHERGEHGRIAGVLDTVQAAAGQQAQQLRLGQGERQVGGGLARLGFSVWMSAPLDRASRTAWAGVGEVPVDDQRLAGRARPVHPDGQGVKELLDRSAPRPCLRPGRRSAAACYPRAARALRTGRSSARWRSPMP